MAQTIEARVFQKADTLSAWMSNPLILGRGEQAFVISDTDSGNIIYKVGDGTKTFAELPWPDYSVKGKVDTTTVWSGMASGVYIPTEDGDYGAINGNVNLSDGYQIIFWDGSIRVKVVFPTDLTGYAPRGDFSIVPQASGSQLFDKSSMTLLDGYILTSDGGTVAAPGTIVRVPISSLNSNLTISGVVGIGVTGPKYYRWIDESGVIADNFGALTTETVLNIPSEAIALDFTARREGDESTALDAIMVNYGGSALPFSPFQGEEALTRYDSKPIAAKYLMSGAELSGSGDNETSVQNKSGVKNIIKETPVVSNLSLTDRWVRGISLLANDTSQRFLNGDGWQPNPNISFSVVNAYDDFGYRGNAVQATVTASTANFYYFINKDKLMLDDSFTGNLYGLIEVVSSVSCTVVLRVWRVTGVNTETQAAITQSISLEAGVRKVIKTGVFSLLGSEDEENVRGIEIRLHAQSPSSFAAGTVITVGRLNIATTDTDMLDAVADFPSIIRLGSESTASKKQIVSTLYNFLSGKKWTVDGDSIDYGTGSTGNVGYKNIVADYFGMTYVTTAVGGTCMGGSAANAMWQDARVNTIPTDTQILTIKAGTNDIAAANAIPLGDIDNETDTNTFYGAWQVYLSKVFTRIPNAEIVLMTFPYKNYPPYMVGENTFEDYRQAIRDIGRKYGLLVADIGAECGINQLNTDSYLPDNTHPNDAGYERISRVIINTFKKIKG